MSDVDGEDESWLDDYEEGSTTEEFIHRMKHGMLLWHPASAAEVIAKETLRQAELRASQRSTDQ